MENQPDINKRILTIRKTLKAPRPLVWEAWTTQEHITQWWAPGGMETKVVQHEFKPGGHWRYVTPMPDGSEFISEGEYTEIIEPERIVTTANFIPMTEGVVMQVLFHDKGDTTEFTFSVIHPTEEYCRQQEQMGFYNGWGTVLMRFNEYVTTLL